MNFGKKSMLLLVLCLSIFALHATTFAVDYKVGEEIEVFYLGKWIPATVLQVNSGGMVRAEFEFIRRSAQAVFKPEAVRKKYESGAIWRGRVWSDSSGSFKIKAALLAVEPGKVHLRKEDGKELSVEIEKLSAADQKFLQQLRKDAGGGTPIALAPRAIQFDNSAVGSESTDRAMDGTWSSARSITATEFQLEPDPQKTTLVLPKVGTKLPVGKVGDNLDTLIPLGGKDGWCLASLSNSFSGEDMPMRVHWAALAKEEVGATQTFPSGQSVLDYHAPSKQLLTFGRQGGSSPLRGDIVLTIWNCSPTSAEAVGIVSWYGKIGDTISSAFANPWARFVSDSMVLQRGDNHRLVAWDTKGKRVAWSAVQESFFAPEPQLSHNGKYLFVPEDLQCRILDPLSGIELGRVTTKMSCSGVALAADGKTLAILTDTQLIVVNLTDSKDIRVLNASSVSMAHKPKLEWVTDDLIAIPITSSEFLLYSLSKGVPVWSYQFDHRVQQTQSNGNKTHAFVKGSMSYAVEIPGSNAFVVGAVAVPEKGVADMVSRIDPKSYMLMGPATAVQLRINTIESEEMIRQALEGQVKSNGWTISPNAAYTITATLKRGESQTVQYENMRSREVVSVTTTPFISAYEIHRGNELIWSSGSSSGVPPVILFGDGTPQSQASKWEKADHDFFTRVDIPDSVMDPAKKGGLGTSYISSRGVEKRK